MTRNLASKTGSKVVHVKRFSKYNVFRWLTNSINGILPTSRLHLWIYGIIDYRKWNILVDKGVAESPYLSPEADPSSDFPLRDISIAPSLSPIC